MYFCVSHLVQMGPSCTLHNPLIIVKPSETCSRCATGCPLNTRDSATAIRNKEGYFAFALHFRFRTLADCFSARYQGLNVDKESELARYREYADRMRPMVIETVSYLHGQMAQGKSVLVEGANAAMLDIDFGES